MADEKHLPSRLPVGPISHVRRNPLPLLYGTLRCRRTEVGAARLGQRARVVPYTAAHAAGPPRPWPAVPRDGPAAEQPLLAAGRAGSRTFEVLISASGVTQQRTPRSSAPRKRRHLRVRLGGLLRPSRIRRRPDPAAAVGNRPARSVALGVLPVPGGLSAPPVSPLLTESSAAPAADAASPSRRARAAWAHAMLHLAWVRRSKGSPLCRGEIRNSDTRCAKGKLMS